MAVVVNISETEHLSYSPLNEKHNILYHRARNNVNVRHIQKPWFDLNPFLDREDDKWKDLDKYRPENDRGIMPLESLTIVEDFLSERPLLTKEFEIGDFWEFLFSEDWSSGYSVRVLEGRLQNLLITCLVSMIQSKAAVQHTTAAFAKNRRQRYSVYKHSEKEPELGEHEETLLVEFIYYGHAVGHEGPGKDDNVIYEENSSEGYPRDKTTTTSSGLSNGSSEFDADHQVVPGSSSRSSTEGTELKALVTPRPPSRQPPGTRQKLLKKRVRISRAAVPSSSETSRHGPQHLIHRNISRVKEQDSSPCTPSYGIIRQNHYSDSSTGSDDYKVISAPLDLNKFMCTERISYLGEFDLSDDSSGRSSDEDGDGFGQEYYLGSQSAPSRAGRCESVVEKLKRRKKIVRQARERRRAEMGVVHEVKSQIFPEFSDLDVTKYLTKAERNFDQDHVGEEVPDLVDYIKMLKADEKKEQTGAYKLKQMKKKLMKKYNIARPNNERFADEVGAVTDSQACKMHCYSTDPSWKAMTARTRQKFLVTKLLAAGGKVKMPKKTPKPIHMKRKIEIPFVYVTTVTGLTYIHPVSKLMMQKRIQEKQERERQEARNATRRRMSLLPATPTSTLSHELSKKRRANIAAVSTKADTAAATTIKLIAETQPESSVDVKSDELSFPKAGHFQGNESPDFDSDEESDGLEESSFHTNKLKIRYSIERIRKARAKETKEKQMRNSTFLGVLRKYYRMQSILKAFGRKPMTRRKSVVRAGFRPRNKTKTKTTKGLEEANEAEEKIVIGKLKWFPFLDKKTARETTSKYTADEPLFDNYPMDKFKLNLNAALDQFVVRREVVISDYTAKASVSITFTKKSVFTKSRNISN